MCTLKTHTRTHTPNPTTFNKQTNLIDHFIPYFLPQKIMGHDGAEDSGGALNLIRLTLSAFSTAYNVFLYVIYNKNFRDGFKALCPMCFVAPRNIVAPSTMRTSDVPITEFNK